jgi:Tfp pilus assembly protein FimT
VVNNSLRRTGCEGGFSLIDMLMAVSMIAILSAIAVPMVTDVTSSIRLGEGAREVERALQSARLKAVSTNRAFRVRFNCPSAREFRVVELIGTPSVPVAADTAANRCNQVNYPYPPADQNPMTKPNHDGPLQRLHPDLSFSPAPTTLEFWPDGTVHADQNGGAVPWATLSGAGTTISIVKGSQSKSITVNGLGRVKLQ